MTKHTQTPYRVGNLASWDGYTGRPYRNIWAGIDNEAHCIARAMEEDSNERTNVDDTAEFIVRACNAHEPLVEALQFAAERLCELGEGHAIIAVALRLARGEQ